MENNSIRKPDFFIVGAPRCGTTSLQYYLLQHPKICMPEKEINFWGDDLKFKKEMTLQEYLGLFSQCGPSQVVGEKSVWYLYSVKASEEIKEFNPNAKIVIVLRNPLNLIKSLHNYFYIRGDETVASLEEAISIPPEKRRSYFSTYPIECFDYLKVAKFYIQVKRYLERFSSVKVIIFEELIKSPYETLRDVFEFLGVNPEVAEQIDFSAQNVSKSIKSKVIRDFLLKYRVAPFWIRGVIKVLLPNQKLRAWLSNWLQDKVAFKNSNIKNFMSDSLKKKLQNELRKDVLKLSDLINKNLIELWGF